MAKKMAAKKPDKAKRIRILCQSRDIKIYKEGGKVFFVYVDRSNDGDNDSFSEAVDADVFKKEIVQLLRTGSCVLSKYLEFKFKKISKRLIIKCLISDCHTFYFEIDNFNLSQLFF